MILRPCTRCRFRNDCPIRKEMRVGMSLAEIPCRVTSMLFDCPKRLEGLHPGARVRLRLKVQVGEQGGGYYEPPEPVFEEVEFTGTSMGWARDGNKPKATAKVRVWLDSPTDRGNTRIALHPDAYEPTGETVAVCPGCARPLDRPKSPRFHCPECSLLEGGAPLDALPGLMRKWDSMSMRTDAEQAVQVLEAARKEPAE